mgnify:FL=1
MTKAQMMEAFAQFMAQNGAIAKPKVREPRKVKPCENIEVEVSNGKAILTIDLTVTGRPTSNNSGNTNIASTLGQWIDLGSGITFNLNAIRKQ